MSLVPLVLCVCSERPGLVSEGWHCTFTPGSRIQLAVKDR